MNGRIIVTGGTGYIGSHTVVELIKAGYQTIIFDNLSNSDIGVLDGIAKITGVKPQFLEVDITDPSACTEAFKQSGKIDGVIHFAALKAVGESVEKPLEYYRNNVSGLIRILENMKARSISNLIFSSSCTVYGQAKDLPVTEDSAVQPAASPYGFTKQVGEQIIKDVIFADALGAAISLRYFNPVGAHESAKIGELPIGVPNNLLPFITQTAAGIREELKVFGNDYDTRDGTCIRDYIHVVDLAAAHVIAMDRLINGRNTDKLEIFNIGTGRGYTVLEVIRSFEKVAGMELPFSFGDRRAGDVVAIYADPSKAKKVLGWEAQYHLDDMTSSAWKWQKNLKYRGKQRN